jgi:hypothetical protein
MYELGRPEITEGEILTALGGSLPSGDSGEAAGAALALWYQESRGMLLTASER